MKPSLFTIFLRLTFSLPLLNSMHAKADDLNHLRYHSDVPETAQKILLADLNSLKKLKLNSSLFVAFPKKLKEGEQLKDWFEERIHYVVWDTFDIEKAISSAPLTNASYPVSGDKNPFLSVDYISSLSAGIFEKGFNQILRKLSESLDKKNKTPSAPVISPAILQKPSSSPFLSPETELRVMAANLVGVYLKGKKENTLYGVEFEKGEVIPYDSTRTGVMVVGENLVGNTKSQLQKKSVSQRIYERGYRLMVLLHEARHSDGNGENAGFSHSLCPMMHEMQKEDACDSASNGAYQIAIEVSQLYISNLENLVQDEIEESKEVLDRKNLDIEKETLLLALQANQANLDSRLFLKNTYFGKKVDQTTKESIPFFVASAKVRKELEYKKGLLMMNLSPLEDVLFNSSDFTELQSALDGLPTEQLKEVAYSSNPESIIENKSWFWHRKKKIHDSQL